MDRFFAPRTVALVGASNDPEKMGNWLISRVADNFSGRICPIHPSEASINGLEVYPEVSAIDEPVDLLVALVPAARLLPLVEGCRPGHVAYLLAIPAGFGEASEDGRELERELLRLTAERGIRVVGPNCMGMLNAVHGLNASLVPEIPPGGAGFSCLTQSGGFGIAVTMYALDHQMPVAKICDLGNTSDVQVSEVLAHYRADPETRVVGLFLEAAREAGPFAAEIRKLAAVKPVVMTGLGRTEAGARASLAHLGLTPDLGGAADAGWSGGVIHAQTGRELLNIAKSLCWQPSAPGRRVAIMTGTGGIGAEFADLCCGYGMEVPVFSEDLQQALAAHLPAYAAVQNPIDTTPIWWEFPRVYPALIETLMQSDEIDQVIVSVTDVATGIEDLATAIAGAPRDKPAFVFWGARNHGLDNMRRIEATGLPCYTTTWETVRALVATSGGAVPPP